VIFCKVKTEKELTPNWLTPNAVSPKGDFGAATPPLGGWGVVVCMYDKLDIVNFQFSILSGCKGNEKFW